MMTGATAWTRKRNGFSLMEIILATAILAASGAALLGLIGQASRFALNAEQRTIALMHAETLLGEYLTAPSMEMEGTVSSAPEWSYRIEASEISLASSNGGSFGGADVGGPVAGGSSIPSDAASMSLQRVEVSVFDISAFGASASGGTGVSSRSGSLGSETVPVVTLVRWVRTSALKRMTLGEDEAGAEFGARAMPGGGSPGGGS